MDVKSDYLVRMIVIATACYKHHVEAGRACWILERLTRRHGAVLGICGDRVKLSARMSIENSAPAIKERRHRNVRVARVVN